MFVHIRLDRPLELDDLDPDPLRERVLDVCARFSPAIGQGAEGGVVVDLGGTERLWGDPVETARRLRAALQGPRVGLGPVGLGPTRTVAWLAGRAAARLDRGLFAVPPGREDAFLGTLPVAWMPGIPPAAHERLRHWNLTSGADLRCLDGELMEALLGPTLGGSLAQLCRGRSPGPGPAAARVRRACALGWDGAPPPTADAGVLDALACGLSETGLRVLRRHRLACGSVGLALVYVDGIGGGARTVRLRPRVDLFGPIREATRALLARLHKRRVKAARLELVLSDALPAQPAQGVLPLAGLPDEVRAEDIEDALELIRGRHGAAAIHRGTG